MKRLGPMAILMQVHSVLSVNGPLYLDEIVDKLELRGFRLRMSERFKHLMMYTDLPQRFGIQKGRFFFVEPDVTQERYTRSSVTKPFRERTVARPRQGTAERKAKIVEFCQRMKRLPSSLNPAEASDYAFIRNHMKHDPTFAAAVARYRKPRGRRPSYKNIDLEGNTSTKVRVDDITIGMQLAESGGTGGF